MMCDATARPAASSRSPPRMPCATGHNLSISAEGGLSDCLVARAAIRWQHSGNSVAAFSKSRPTTGQHVESALERASVRMDRVSGGAA